MSGQEVWFMYWVDEYIGVLLNINIYEIEINNK